MWWYGADEIVLQGKNLVKMSAIDYIGTVEICSVTDKHLVCSGIVNKTRDYYSA